MEPLPYQRHSSIAPRSRSVHELYALTQFQEWMKRQNGNVIVTDGPSVEESDSNYYVRNIKDGIVYCIYAWANSLHYHIL